MKQKNKNTVPQLKPILLLVAKRMAMVVLVLEVESNKSVNSFI